MSVGIYLNKIVGDFVKKVKEAYIFQDGSVEKSEFEDGTLIE